MKVKVLKVREMDAQILKETKYSLGRSRIPG
jgi:hypothetical protein